MAMIRSKLDGTMAPAFSIGKRGPTLHQGADDPNTQQKEGSNGDLYVQIGATPKLYQFRATQWVVFEGSGSFKRSFSSTDLDMMNVIVVQHDLDEEFPDVTVYNDTRRVVLPDEVYSVDANNVRIDLGSYGNIQGNWNVTIRK